MTDEQKIEFAELCGLRVSYGAWDRRGDLPALLYENGDFYSDLSDYHPDRDLNQALLNVGKDEAIKMCTYLFRPIDAALGITNILMHEVGMVHEFFKKPPDQMAALIVEARMKIAEEK